MARASPIGMACAFRFSRDLGLCPGQDAVRVESHLKAVGLPTRIAEIPGLDADARGDPGRDAPGQEGRARPADLHPRAGIGESFIARDVDEASVLAFLKHGLSGGRSELAAA